MKTIRYYRQRSLASTGMERALKDALNLMYRVKMSAVFQSRVLHMVYLFHKALAI